MKTHGMGYAKELKLRFRVGDLDLPERRKRYAISREEDVATKMCPCGTTIQSRTHIVGECEISKKERDALVMRKLDGCDKEEFRRLEISEKTITILGDWWWPQTVKQDAGTGQANSFYVIYGRSVISAQMLEVSPLGE